MSHALIDARHIRLAGARVEVPNGMFPSESPTADLALPALDVRALARRAALPALFALAAVAGVLLLQSHVHVVADSIRRVLDVNPGWALAAVVLECLSLAGYVVLLWLVAGRAAPSVG